MKEIKVYRPRSIDRALFLVLAVLQLFNGLYLVGPWYLTDNEEGERPIEALFEHDLSITIYGCLVLINGIALIYATIGRSTIRFTRIVSYALLSGFLLRLYALLGVFLTLESWRPPMYLSHVATVFVMGSYWVWVNVNTRTPK